MSFDSVFLLVAKKQKLQVNWRWEYFILYIGNSGNENIQGLELRNDRKNIFY